MNLNPWKHQNDVLLAAITSLTLGGVTQGLSFQNWSNMSHISTFETYPRL